MTIGKTTPKTAIAILGAMSPPRGAPASLRHPTIPRTGRMVTPRTGRTAITRTTIPRSTRQDIVPVGMAIPIRFMRGTGRKGS